MDLNESQSAVLSKSTISQQATESAIFQAAAARLGVDPAFLLPLKTGDYLKIYIDPKIAEVHYIQDTRYQQCLYQQIKKEMLEIDINGVSIPEYLAFNKPEELSRKLAGAQQELEIDMFSKFLQQLRVEARFLREEIKKKIVGVGHLETDDKKSEQTALMTEKEVAVLQDSADREAAKIQKEVAQKVIKVNMQEKHLEEVIAKEAIQLQKAGERFLIWQFNKNERIHLKSNHVAQKQDRATNYVRNRVDAKARYYTTKKRIAVKRDVVDDNYAKIFCDGQSKTHWKTQKEFVEQRNELMEASKVRRNEIEVQDEEKAMTKSLELSKVVQKPEIDQSRIQQRNEQYQKHLEKSQEIDEQYINQMKQSFKEPPPKNQTYRELRQKMQTEEYSKRREHLNIIKEIEDKRRMKLFKDELATAEHKKQLKLQEEQKVKDIFVQVRFNNCKLQSLEKGTAEYEQLKRETKLLLDQVE